MLESDVIGQNDGDLDSNETKEWLDSLTAVVQTQGPGRAGFLLSRLGQKAQQIGVAAPFTANTPYINTVPPDQEAPLSGDLEVGRRLTHWLRWNAMAMVVRANKDGSGVGGHISSYASAVALIEVGLNHFFKGPDAPGGGDQVYFQGHAAPGLYARAFLEGRLTEQQLLNFRRELSQGGGLSSYPHPWLMPSFWQFPTVSMGLGPLMAIYQARFNRYLHNRGVKDTSQQRVWCFMGDGETDEPESLGALTLAAREKLDNLTFIVNCNLQRLDGPVRGNGKIIQELEAAFRGAGWNVIKVIWGTGWDQLLARDTDGLLVTLMGQTLDGEYQRLGTASGAYLREHFFGKYPALLKLIEDIPDEQLRKMLVRGGHDPQKVYAAYHAAIHHKGAPSVILAKTIKGYGLGEAGEGRNVTHQQKKLNEEELAKFCQRFNIPLSEADRAKCALYKPPDDSPELEFLRQQRKQLGGSLPSRVVRCPPLKPPPLALFQSFLQGSGGKAVSTTMACVEMLKLLLGDKELGKYVVPIIPDEARTFGMESLFRRHGIYASQGQLYEPIDSQTLVPYHEAKDGQILEEGITEAGAISSFVAAGTAYATHGVPMIPFFAYYSMFGFQRVGDSIWAAADMRARGFLLGATAGRTTLNGEGLQHQDGHSHILASVVPSLLAYDPAFAYEIAVILQDGIRRMYQAGESVFYYLTLGNENYEMLPIPRGANVEDGIRRGMYKCRPASSAVKSTKSKVHLLGSGAILREAMRAQEILVDRYQIAADVWSVTSYKELRRDALETERWNFLHPMDPPRQSYLEQLLAGETGVFVAASDYMKALPEMIARWVPGGLSVLGTDGFGRSETRQALRRFFEIDAECITLQALTRLARLGEVKPSQLQKAIQELGIDPEKVDPMKS
jgi:pyruvate dehydrogenase E1 component